MTTSREVFTSSELITVLEELGVTASLQIVHDDDGLPLARIECQIGQMEWTLLLGDEEPFYSRALIVATAFISSDVDALEFVNSWNDNHLDSVAIADIDEKTGRPGIDVDGYQTVLLRKFISFVGHVSEKHVAFQFEVWIEDLADLVGADDDAEEFHESGNAALNQERTGVTDLDLLHKILSTNGPMSSKELSRSLVLPKHDINHLIYMHLDEFVKYPGQPPKWTSRRQ